MPILRNDLIPKTLDLVNPRIPPLSVAGDRAAVLFLLEFAAHFCGCGRMDVVKIERAVWKS